MLLVKTAKRIKHKQISLEGDFFEVTELEKEYSLKLSQKGIDKRRQYRMLQPHRN